MQDDIASPELVARAQGGEEPAIHELFASIRPPIRRFVERRFGTDSAEDRVQDVLCKVFRTLHRFDASRGVRFRTWVMTIARNHCIDILKKRRIHLLSFSAIRKNDDLLDLEDDTAIEPVALLERQELRHRVDSALDEVPRQHRDVFVMREHGLDYTEIASRLGASSGAVKSRHRRAKVALRRKLRDLRPTGPAAA